MLQLLSLIKNPRLSYQAIPSLSNARYRYMSDKTKKPDDGDKCEQKEVKKPDCKSEPKAESDPKAENEPKAGSDPKKAECKKDAPPKKDETAISGGASCKAKKKPPPCPPPPKEKKRKQLSCEELVLKREGLQKTEATCPSKISGGGPKCPCTPCPKPPPDYKNSKKWQKISIMGGLPLIAILTVLVFTSRKEEERPEYRHWSHLYLRGYKPYFFRDGNTTAFHNTFWNPLPPDGYEDEIDVEANGKTVETDKEREDRLKEFGAVQKQWKKYDGRREAEAKKRQAAAEKEAKQQQSLAEKEEKKQMAEAEKEQKRLNAEADKERKRQEAEAAKENKRQEEEMKKQAKEEAKKVEFAFIKSRTDDEK
ncbi:chromatin assembly factor 1 subunit A isoform X2 [Drosophila montana]|uniref:chromatin assembly factor 1 subunit A isoform X2 n=1 Tax=Drosophila montana TaxID=40370 RepID=UPI00313BC3DF